MKSKSLDEIIEMQGEMKVVEEFLNVDNSLIEFEKSRDLIRLEMNIVEFPIFSKNSLVKMNQIRKYYFSADKTSYLEILPSVNTQIPGEVEERVFIALTKILRNNGFKQTFYCTLNDILDNMKIDNRGTRNGLYPKVKQAISKMANTTYKFKNLFYSNEKQRTIDDLIETNILTYRSITFKEANESESNFFADKRTKELYKITLSEHFFENIIRKGYLAFDADELLSIKDSVTRSIYTMITKWRNNNLFLKKQAYFIARRIPLAWDKNPRRTILRIEKSLIELKNYSYIKDYNLIKKDKWERAEFEIFFDEAHNIIKRNTFFDEKNSFDKMVHMIEERDNELSVNTTELFEDPQFMEILNIFPAVARKLKTLPLVIREALKKYDYNFVQYTAEYTSLNCKTSYIKYFKDALANNWGEQYIAKKELKVAKKTGSKNKIEEAELVEDTPLLVSVTWDEYLLLSTDQRRLLEEETYKDFLNESNSADTKIMRGIFEKSKKPLILKTFSKHRLSGRIFNDTTKDIIESITLESTSIISEKTEEIKEINTSSHDKKTYETISVFMMECLKYFRENTLNINHQDFMTLFTFMKVYEDSFVKMSYDEATKIGEIIKK